MDYRLATLWPRANYTADKTEIIDINLVDSVSRIVVVYQPREYRPLRQRSRTPCQVHHKN